jgi:hypothetical protein
MRIQSKKFFIVVATGLLFGALSEGLFAQSTNTAVPFLLISPGSRASAMGEAGVAMSDDASAIYWNPAGLGFQKGSELTLTHSNWLPQFNQSDLFYEYGNFKMNLPKIGGTFGVGLQYLSLGQFERRDEANQYLGTFNSFELAVTSCYGTKLDEDIAVGLGLKLIYSSLSQLGTAHEAGSGTATTVAGDIGFLYRPSKFVIPFTDEDLGDRFAIGTSISNIGPSVHYIDEAQADPLPTALRIGFSYDLVKEEYNKFTWTTDVMKLLVSRTGSKADPFYSALGKSFSTGNVLSSFTLATGIEYWYSNLVALRFGFFHEDPRAGNRRFLTFGAGVRYDIYGFDFSYLSTSISDQISPLAETLRFTLTILWGTPGPQDDTNKTPQDDSVN